MRNSTRLRFFLAAASVTSLAAIFVAACGDDDPNADITAPPDSGPSETSTVDNFRPDTGGGSDAGSDVKQDTGPVYNAGDAAILEAGPEYDGGIACVLGGQIEEEINDQPDSGNQLRTTADAGCTGNGCSRCGVIFDSDPDAGADAGDGGLGGTEVEFVTFQLHPSTTSFFLQYGGNVTLIVTVDGDANQYVINSVSTPTLPYAAGKNYYVEVRSNTGAQTPWRVTLFENQ